MKRFYVVEATIEMPVVADSEAEAEAVAEEHLRDELSGADFRAQESKTNYGWGNFLPYGGDDDRTIDQWLEAIQAAEEPVTP